MNGVEIYKAAISQLGYPDNTIIANRAVLALSLTAAEIAAVMGMVSPQIDKLSDRIELPENTLSALIYGLAERLALGEGDGELQCYFADRFDREKRRFNFCDNVEDVMP